MANGNGRGFARTSADSAHRAFRGAVAIYNQFRNFGQDFKSTDMLEQSLSDMERLLANLASADVSALRNAVPALKDIINAVRAMTLLDELTIGGGIYGDNNESQRALGRLAHFNELASGLGIEIELTPDNFFEEGQYVGQQLRGTVEKIAARLPEVV